MKTLLNKELDPKILGKEKKLKTKIQKLHLAQKQNSNALKIKNLFEKEDHGQFIIILLKSYQSYLKAEENEKTLQFRQKDLEALLPMKNQQNVFSLNLPFGGYHLSYSANGQYQLLTSTMGHIAVLNTRTKELVSEFNVHEKTLSNTFLLPNHSQFAVAQKHYLYIYDTFSGEEIHRLKNHIEPKFIFYLPYHFVLMSISRLGFLKYQDISTGHIVSEYRTKIREPCSSAYNQSNGIISIGDSFGKVQMFSPNQQSPVVQIYAHKSSVASISINHQGNYMATLGFDGNMKVWDIRYTYKDIFNYWTPSQAYHSNISQTGLLAVSNKKSVLIWKVIYFFLILNKKDWYLEKQKRPYMKQETQQEKEITDLKFQPYEDFLGIGEYEGFESICIPGAGEASFDQFEVPIYTSKKQRSEAMVQKLLEKLPVSTIMLNPSKIGNIDNASKEVLAQEEKQEKLEKEQKMQKNKKKKNKKVNQKALKQKEFVHDEKTLEMLREQNYTRLQIKKAEKSKQKKEIELLNEGAFEFDPVDALEKKIKVK